MSNSFSAQWRPKVVESQEGKCLICGEFIYLQKDGDWDHFVPVAISSNHLKNHRIGISFWTHKKCNGKRGNQVPTKEMTERAVAAVARLQGKYRTAAEHNLKTTLAEFKLYVRALEDMFDAGC